MVIYEQSMVYLSMYFLQLPPLPLSPPNLLLASYSLAWEVVLNDRQQSNLWPSSIDIYVVDYFIVGI